jgi:auxin efflux carrier family protein
VQESVKQGEEHRREHEEEDLVEAREPLLTEETSLIPDGLRAAENRREHAFYVFSKRWNQLRPRAQSALSFLSDFFNAPLGGLVIGAFIGLVNPLHKVFFNQTFEGG